ncbi:Mss4-like protein [Lophiotrema nucula]|uniref:Mss4-like protein n=1 Tax=Lophiotrema nucula TaxID=690887 RepID=A0A6A5YIR1_9PLEO|nr:Mss4-like protein [Lophiotrema nucula]
MATARPFPKVTGGCFCRKTRYRIETAPLFCYACHCQDCQKASGSVFACYASIERDRVTSIGELDPSLTVPVPGVLREQARCSSCQTILWACGDYSPASIDIKVGTLDIPTLMEPDMHAFIESKVDWVGIPEGAKTCKGDFDRRDAWPKASLERLRVAMQKHDKAMEENKALAEQRKTTPASSDVPEDDEDGADASDKTPTAQSPDEKETDEEFEKRFKETESTLLARLEQLSKKLSQEETPEAAMQKLNLDEQPKDP